MATTTTDVTDLKCMVCSTEISEVFLPFGDHRDLCSPCQDKILARFKRVYASLMPLGQRQFAAYFDLKKSP